MDISSKARESYKRQLSFRVNISKIMAAGLAVIASDTGRILMLQRALSEEDPASGKWEFPGGTLNPDESPFDASLREWSEETGLNLPLNAKIQGDWIAPNGRYQLFIYRIPAESDIELNLDHEDRHVSNPDDPDGDEVEVIAWWSLEDLPTNPALRDEVKNTDWKIFQNSNSITAATDILHEPFDFATGPCCRPQGGGTGCGNPNCKSGWQAKEREILENADPRVRAHLERMLTGRREVEPKYTELLSGITKQHSGKMLGLSFKFKDAQGIANKIERKVVEKGITHEQSADSIADALRYTVAISPDNYVNGMKSAVKALTRSGGVVFESFENNWQPGDAYNGVNAVFRDKKTGLKIELQFHTPESFIVKDKVNHKNYELIRERKGTALDRFQAFMSMKSKSDAIQFPVGVINLEGFGIPIKSVFRPFDEPMAIAAAGTPISKVLNWNEAERLSVNGTMTQGDWEDFVDSALGYGGGFELLPNKKIINTKLQSSTVEFANPCHAPDTGRFCETDGPAFPSQDVQRPLNPKPPKNYHQESEEWISKLTEEERKAASDYTGSYLYGEINKNAVAGTSDPRVNALDSALAKAGKRETPIRVYRRVGVKDRDAFMASVEIGSEISLTQEGAFQSASITPRYPVITGWPTNSVLFEINTRSGAAIGDVTQGGGTAKELEVLIPRNTKFRVVGIQEDVQFGPPPKTRGLGDTGKRLVVQVEEI